jgi:acetoin utilization protein AcuC
MNKVELNEYGRRPKNALIMAFPKRKAVLIAATERRPSYGNNHPLAIPRVSLTLDLIQSYGALMPQEFLPARKASSVELGWFHASDYIRALQHCEVLDRPFDRYRRRYNIGTLENPYFPGLFSIPATAAGASIQGAEEVLMGRIAFNPAGGMHHGLPHQAQGFCFLNDPALGILRLRKAGLRVLYLDLDAHYGDGVEYAFRNDPGVLTVSLHMDTRYAYPFHGGGIEDTGRLANACNLPLPPEVNDTEYRLAFNALWPQVLHRFVPNAVVLQAGTDILYPDPLGKFNISTQLFLEVVERVLEDCPHHADGTRRLLVLGGGGYHPIALARCWLGVWGVLSGRNLPVEIPEEGRALLHAVRWDQDEDEGYYPSLFENRLDSAREGPVRGEVTTRVQRILDHHPLFNTRFFPRQRSFIGSGSAM